MAVYPCLFLNSHVKTKAWLEFFIFYVLNYFLKQFVSVFSLALTHFTGIKVVSFSADIVLLFPTH